MLKEKSRLNERLEELELLQKTKQNIEEWIEVVEEDPDYEFLEALNDEILKLQKLIKNFELKTLLSSPEDKKNAILEIHPGAGGTDAQDWAEMLFRMYKRWAEEKGFKVELLDYLAGEEAGIKSVTLGIEGRYAYGLLKGEKGVHRLIRISPFDTSGRRHTSFASVDVYPEVDEEINIEIKDEDVKIEVFRAGGPGGQSVNKTSSAVRITHLPTGIVVQCQNERSQYRNKEIAFKILRARLYELELKKKEEEKQREYAQKDSIAWGNQIRTYILHPYRLVKDHRTNVEIKDVERVLDGDIDEFIKHYLLKYHDRSQ